MEQCSLALVYFYTRMRKRYATLVIASLVLFPCTMAFAGLHQPFPVARSALLDSLLQYDELHADSTVAKGENVRLVSSALAVLLGPFGAHRLYLGTNTKVALVYGLTLGGFGILAVLDLGHLLLTKDLTPYRNNGKVFMWGKGAAAPTPP